MFLALLGAVPEDPVARTTPNTPLRPTSGGHAESGCGSVGRAAPG
jgi:hypothetical protein